MSAAAMTPLVRIKDLSIAFAGSGMDGYDHQMRFFLCYDSIDIVLNQRDQALELHPAP